MPRIEEFIDPIGPAQVISTLDLVKGYRQIPMDQRLKDKTTFTTPLGYMNLRRCHLDYTVPLPPFTG